MDWTQFVEDEPTPAPSPAPAPAVDPAPAPAPAPRPSPWDAFVEDPATAARRQVGTAARDRLSTYLNDPSEKLRAHQNGWDAGTLQHLQSDADDEDIAEGHLVRALSPPPAPMPMPVAAPAPPREAPMVDPSTPDGLGGYLAGAFPGTAQTLGRLGAGVDAGATGLARGAAGALDAARIPVAPGMSRADALQDIDVSAANADRQVVGAGHLTKTAVDLAPWFLGPAGMAVGAATSGGNRRLDVLDRETGGDPTAATAREEALADAAGLIDAGVSVAAPKVGGGIVDAALGKAGTAALERYLAGRLATRTLHGAASGAAIGAGEAGVSAATGDTERAKGELASIGMQALVGGGLGAGGAALHEIATGGRSAPARAGGIDEAAQTQTDLRPVAGGEPRLPDAFVTESGETDPDLRARIAEEDARGFERVRAAARSRARFRADSAAETLPEIDKTLMPAGEEDSPTVYDRTLSDEERAKLAGRRNVVPEAADETVGDRAPITFPTPPPREVKDFLAENGVDWNVDLERANGRSRPLLNSGTRDVRPEFTDTKTEPVDVPVAPGRPTIADVPYGGGTSEDGSKVYIDPRIPRFVDVNGKPADAHRYIDLHERAEKPLLDQGVPYEEAHQRANAVERAAVEADGHDWNAYSKALEPHLDAARAMAKAPPADLGRKPYTDSGEAHLLAPRAAAPRAAGDILDTMIEEGGVAPRPKNLPAGAGEHDDRPKLTGKARAAYAGTVPPDQMAQRLQARGYGDGTVNTMHRLAREAQETRQAAPGQRAEDVLAHDSSAPPEANQRATSARPDLAIPSENTPTREAFKAADQERTAAGKSEPVKDADVAKEAQERVAADFEGERAKISRKLEDGGVLDQHETMMHQRIIERLVGEGRTEEAAREIVAYRVAGGDAARAFRARIDPSEPPAKRVQRAIVEKVLDASRQERQAIERARASGDKARAKALTDQAAKKAQARVEKIKAMTGIDPHDLAGEKTPKRTVGEKVSAKIKRASVEVDREFLDLRKRLRDVWKSKTTVGSTGGEAVDILSKMIANRLKRGLLTAADVAVAMARQLPELRKDVRLQRAFKQAWNDANGEKIAGDPAPLFAKTPKELLKDAEGRLTAAQAEKGRVESLTPGERMAELKAKRDQAKNVPEDVQKLRDRAAALRREIAEGDKEILPPEPPEDAPPKPLDEQLADARAKLARAAEKHQAAAGQTDAERLAAVKARVDAKESLHPEVQALHDTAAELSRQVAARDRKVYLNALRVQDADRTVKANGWDMEDELWRNGLHTSLQLPIVKLGSDVANRLLSFVSDDVGRALINHALPGGRDTASLADLPHIAAGMLPALRLGLKMGWDSLLNDRNVFSDEVRAARAAKDGDLGAADEFHQSHALPKVLHNVTGWNLRAIGALQAAAESFFARMHVGADAYRLAFDAQGKRLTGDALANHMREQLADIASPAWTEAVKGAHYDTGVTSPPKGGPIAGITRLKRMDVENGFQRVAQVAARKLAPFTVLPVNYLVRGVYHLTPLNTFTPVYRSLRSLTGVALGRDGMTYSRAQFNTDAARSLLAWGTMLTVGSMLDDDKGRPRITGYGTYEPSDMDLPTPPKHSVQWGGQWHDYTRVLGPAGHALGLMVDALRGVKSTVQQKGGGAPVAPGDAAKAMLRTVKEHVTDEAFLRSVHDLAGAFESEGSGAKYLGTFAASYVPTFIKQAAKAAEPDIQNSRVHEGGFFPRAAQAFEHNIGVPSAPMVDIFGKEIAKDDPVQSTSSYVTRLLNPANGPLVNRDDAQPYRDMIQRWNDLNPTAKLKFATPAARLEVGGKQVPMTDQQYHDLLIDAGSQTFQALEDARRSGEIDVENPTAENAELVRQIVKRSQAAARLTAKASAIDEGRATPTRPLKGGARR